MNLYQEVAHVPLFVHDPRRPATGLRIDRLTQAIDLCPTFLDLHGVKAGGSIEGVSLLGDVRRALNTEGKSASSNDRPGFHASSQPDDRVTEIKRRCQQRREDLIKQFESELTKVGGCFHRATTAESAFQVVEQIVADREARTRSALR